MSGEPIHPVYLPFSREVLQGHFAVTRQASDGRHLRYFVDSVARGLQLEAAVAAGGSPTPAQVRLGRQMEKDERFWVVAALLAAYYVDDGRGRVDALAELLRRAGVEAPAELGSWEAALAGELLLTFETRLSSPQRYREWLRDRVDERTTIPHLHTVASRPGAALEGATHVDALLLAPDTGVAVLFEAKVLSDISTHITYDLMRNQIARNIDVMLDPTPPRFGVLSRRRSERSFFVLLTPAPLQDDGPAAPRLYGHLMRAYRRPEALHAHLPHRELADLASVPDRLGWLTWEDVAEVVPGSCAWLRRPQHQAPG